ncbi:helicase [Aureococcus anophagefferens]|nr:helicase [Aureococcus anophagefferens]
MDMLKQLEAKLGADSDVYKKVKAQLMLKELEAKLGADSDVYKKVKAQLEAQQQSSAPAAPPQQPQQPAPPQQPPAPQPQSSTPAAPPPPQPPQQQPPQPPPAAAPRRGSRAKVSRTMEIDGHTVLCENNYDVTASHYEYGERPADPPRPAPAKKPRTERAAPAPRPPTAGELKRAAQNEALRAEMASRRRARGLESLDWFADRHERCGALPACSATMGLGKTLQTIAPRVAQVREAAAGRRARHLPAVRALDVARRVRAVVPAAPS